MLALAAIGLSITGYLTVVALAGTQALFCAAGSACEVVQGSRWSILLGVPMALWGFALYALLALSAWRMSNALTRWRRLWLLALAGLTVSVYLTVVAAVELDALCPWCLASLATITAIFLTTTLRRPDGAPGMPWRSWLLNGGAVALTVALALHAYHSGLFRPAEDPRLRALATHLDRSGAKFYGAFWCPKCQQQKRLFGASADRLPYVECSPNGRNGGVAFACVSNEIGGYPTWIIEGQRFEQVLTPEELARYTEFGWRDAAEP